MSSPPLLRVDNLKTHYFGFGGSRVVKAVDDISFTLEDGETFGLIGESGCGKTTISVRRLLSPAPASSVAASCSRVKT